MNSQRALGIEWHLTYKCNLSCLHCGAAFKYRYDKFIKSNYNVCKKKELLIDQLRYADVYPFLENLEKSGHLYSISFSPNIGESTIHPDFVDIWNHISKMNSVYSVNIITNGILFYKLIDRLSMHKLRNAIFSLDGGTAEVHNLIRGKGTFEKVLKSIRATAEQKQHDRNFTLQINYTLNNLNIDSLQYLPELVGDLKTNIIINLLKMIDKDGNAKKNRNLLWLDFRRSLEGIKQFHLNLNKINKLRSKKNLPPMKFRVDYATKGVYRILNEMDIGLEEFIPQFGGDLNSRCGAYSNSKIQIDPFGNIFPCGAFVDPVIREKFYSHYKNCIPVPNIFEYFDKDIIEIFDSQFFSLAKEWIATLDEMVPCNRCKYHNACGFCPIYIHMWGVPNECQKI